jgi:hypothetical protein
MALFDDATVFTSQLSTYKQKSMRISLFALLMLPFLASCEKETEATKANEIIECSGTLNSDSASLAGLAVGSWNLELYTKPYTAVFIKAERPVKATFNADQSFVVKENSTVIAQGTWSLRKNGTYVDMEISNINEYIGGPISICGDKLLFSKSFFDGSDYLFVRTN